jgi:hypothetical protein
VRGSQAGLQSLLYDSSRGDGEDLDEFVAKSGVCFAYPCESSSEVVVR